MDSERLDRAKQACLKQGCGAVLSSEEQEILEQFLASDSGREFHDNSEELRRLLSEVAEVTVASIDSSAMLASFEARARTELRDARGRLPLTLLLTSGIGLLAGTLGFSSGKEELAFFSWTMLGFALVCTIVFVAIWKRQGDWLGDPDLLLRMREERDAGESKSAVIFAAIAGLVFLIVLGVGIAKAGGVLAVGISAIILVLAVSIGLPHHRRRQLQDQELWDWWDGRTADG